MREPLDAHQHQCLTADRYACAALGLPELVALGRRRACCLDVTSRGAA
jgi:hypothetical protein